ncbi:MAG: AbrB/MazE/SpoVT family DNA-binding domain-containing protein [Deltaproteobacteria bacterium]|jgi:antitoxin MazE|nr:AbrB/MazE/SpoVT family DNA-binding domain-containing protein [Deltaproteobacteria bacterium]
MDTTTICKWGNSLGVRLPKVILEKGNFVSGDQFKVELVDGTISLKKIVIPKYRFADIKERFTVQRQTEEMNWGASEGREIL